MTVSESIGEDAGLCFTFRVKDGARGPSLWKAMDQVWTPVLRVLLSFFLWDAQDPDLFPLFLFSTGEILPMPFCLWFCSDAFKLCF